MTDDDSLFEKHFACSQLYRFFTNVAVVLDPVYLNNVL